MTKVFVGMSGGVDSSVTAGLLVRAGHQVTGVYMKNWSQDLPGMRCPWADDLADAKRVAVRLGIDLKVYDFETDYKQKVVDYMLTEYQAGRTPNPDIMCNQEIKFKLFLNTALENGAEMIATGHYARKIERNNQAYLGLAIDQSKDQTYFLYRVTNEALQRTLFPLGELHKTEVRELAKKMKLITAQKKDSQGICFVGQVGIEEFLREYIDLTPGEIIDRESGLVLGHHKGAILYTIGQRHGLELGGGLPYFVVGKDMSKNQVFVSRNINQTGLWTKEIKLVDVFWTHEKPVLGQKYQVRLRHLARLIEAEIVVGENDTATIQFATDQKSIASGQSVVVYDGELCLGGGVAR
ncbi:MAG: tRNA 2-thiouridine(34) synthase MnmA [Candidatus Saccharibacteria bacterium]|nr:tRNA 2-thiouridine(34) synthase MnmA [Candidatus Saccharibacteria bacterium]